MARPLLAGLVERHYRLWPVVLGSFMLVAWFLIELPLNSIGVLTITVSTVGIAGMLLLSRRIADWDALAKPLMIVGTSTLYIYVMHKVPLFYMKHGLSALDLRMPGMDFLLVVAIVPICVVFRPLGRPPARTRLALHRALGSPPGCGARRPAGPRRIAEGPGRLRPRSERAEPWPVAREREAGAVSCSSSASRQPRGWCTPWPNRG